MSYITKAIHKDGMAFDVELEGHKFTIDAAPEFGGHNYGFSPKKQLLSSLIGCTAMDVVSLLKKMQVPFDSFEIEADGDLSDEHPKVFTAIRLEYIFTGAQLVEEKIRKAIDLSLNRYCGVAATLRHTATIDYTLTMN